MKTWKNNKWFASAKSTENGVEIIIGKAGVRRPEHKEVVPFGGIDNIPLSIPKYVVREALELMIQVEEGN